MHDAPKPRKRKPPKRICGVAEQQAFLDEEKVKAKRKDVVNPDELVSVYRKQGFVIVNGPKVKLTQKELLDLAQQLSK